MSTIEPLTILRYYKATDENLEALETPFIFLFNARQWKDQAELQFEIDVSDPDKLKTFIDEVITQQMQLPKDSQEYQEYFTLRFNLLKEAGKAEVYSGSSFEKDEVVHLLLEKILIEPKQQVRKGVIRSNFFSRTGISCFTAQQESLTDRFHWDAFANGGTGFCVKYGWPTLAKYFSESKAGIRGEQVSYYLQVDKPKLILSSNFSEAVVENYCKIIFSLGQIVKDEKEFRLAKVFPDDVDDKSAVRRQSIPAEAIKKIILGPNIDPGFQSKIVSIGSKLNPVAIIAKADAPLPYTITILKS